jgi:HAD superfamily hydrolase (TIGR01459 family)
LINYETIGGLGEIASRYSMLFVDAYGVLHDGAAAFPGAPDALVMARQNGTRVVIVTNSADRVDRVVQRLTKSGVSDECYDHVISSGELTWLDLIQRNKSAPVLPRLLIAREGPGPHWIADLPNQIVETSYDADLFVAAGMPYPSLQQFEASGYINTLAAAAQSSLPLVVADSDETYPSHGTIRLGPGLLARRYRELGGTVVEFGKPHVPIYEAALGLGGICARSSILMIGDNLRTDIAGAVGFGIDSLLVLNGGVHGSLTANDLQKSVADLQIAPNYVARSLRW